LGTSRRRVIGALFVFHGCRGTSILSASIAVYRPQAKVSDVGNDGKSGAPRQEIFVFQMTHLQSQYRILYDRSMKTTLDINDQLLADAKALAAQQRTSLTRVIEEGLQLRLRSQAAPQRGKLRLPIFKGRGGLAAGVDPLSNKAMLAALGDDA